MNGVALPPAPTDSGQPGASTARRASFSRKRRPACSYKLFICSLMSHFIYNLVTLSYSGGLSVLGEIVYISINSIILENGNDV